LKYKKKKEREIERLELRDKKCLVTGGAGFIGSHLVDYLLGAGVSVRVLDNLATGKLENLAQHSGRSEFEFREGSILDRNTVRRAMSDVSVVFHLACLGVRHSIRFPEENHRVNAEGTLNLLITARESVGLEYFTCVSSSEVYGASRRETMNEDHPAFPHTVYGASKLAGEAYARAFYITYGLPVVIIRPFNVYGPRSHFESDAGEMIPKSILRALTGHPILIFGDGTQERDFTFVTDTARALVEITSSRAFTGETVNIGSGSAITILELARKIVNLTPESNCGIVHTEPRPGDVKRLLCNPELLKKKLGFKPEVSLDEGLARVIEWFKSNKDKLQSWFALDSGKNWK
jgi:UDP-glucose 4-epimerase